MDGTATQMRWGQKHAFAKNNLRPIMYYAKCPNACSVASRIGCYSYYAILSLGHVVHTAGLHEYSPVLFFGVMNRPPGKTYLSHAERRKGFDNRAQIYA